MQSQSFISEDTKSLNSPKAAFVVTVVVGSEAQAFSFVTQMSSFDHIIYILEAVLSNKTWQSENKINSVI